MSDKAYRQFRDLPVGAIFIATNAWATYEDGTPADAFVKVTDETFRRTYDNVYWRADVEILGKTAMYDGKKLVVAKGWDGVRVLDEVPKHMGFIDEAECERRSKADAKRLAKYLRDHNGEYPDQGFW